MTWLEISDYLKSGKLDVPDDELDVYAHLKKQPLPVLPPDLPAPDETASLHFDIDTTPEASTAITNTHVVTPALPTNDKVMDVYSAVIAARKEFPDKIASATAEELQEALKPVPSSTPNLGKSGRDHHNVSALNVGDHLVYQGTVLASARVMASLKGKSYDGKRKFRATQVGNEIHITRYE